MSSKYCMRLPKIMMVVMALEFHIMACMHYCQVDGIWHCSSIVFFFVQGSVFEVRNSFNELHYWNLQNRPTSDGKLMQALKYTRLANTVRCLY